MKCRTAEKVTDMEFECMITGRLMHQHLKDKGAHEKTKPLAVMEDYKQDQCG
jgi:hypothetical protein